MLPSAASAAVDRRLDVGGHGGSKPAAAGTGEWRASDLQRRGGAARAAAGRGGGRRTYENRVGIEVTPAPRGSAFLGRIKLHAPSAVTMEIDQVERISAGSQIDRAQGVGCTPPAIPLHHIAAGRVGRTSKRGEGGAADRQTEPVVAVDAEGIPAGLAGGNRERPRSLHHVVGIARGRAARQGEGIVVAKVASARPGTREVQVGLGRIGFRVGRDAAGDDLVGCLHAADGTRIVRQVRGAGEAGHSVGETQARGARRPGASAEARLRPGGAQRGIGRAVVVGRGPRCHEVGLRNCLQRAVGGVVCQGWVDKRGDGYGGGDRWVEQADRVASLGEIETRV